MKHPRITLVLDNVNMGLGHDGLSLLARKFHKSVDKIEDDELLLFLNRAKDKLKIMGGAGRVIGYLRMPRGSRIALEAIQFIPQTFGASGFNYEEALRKSLELKLGATTKPTKLGPLTAYRAMERGSGLTARMTT